MLNLLDQRVSRTELADVLADREYQLIPSCESLEWERARRNPAVRKWKAAIDARVDRERNEALPPLPDDLYALFYRTGERLPFESVYFERRRRLGRLAASTVLSDPERRRLLLPILIERIEETMAEESWTFPAHAWTEPTGKDPYKIDLFAAETANVMGELDCVFGEMLPRALRQRIRARLHEQMFVNYLHPRSEITWKHLPMNWNAVCHQGVLGAALALEADHDLVAEMLESAAECLPKFLAGFGEDGSTSEGPGYWSYGFGRFAELNCQLETATRGRLSFFGTNEKVRRIAQFAPAMVFSNGYMVNFSDGMQRDRLGPALLGYLGKRLNLPSVAAESAWGFRHEAEAAINLDSQRCDFFHFDRLCLRCPEDVASAHEPHRPDRYFEDYGAVVCRGADDAWEFAAKGGHNAEHHNHNDCGSWIFHIGHTPAVVEIGAPEYVGSYFSSDETRYTFLASRSLGHSVPLIRGCEQAAGAEFAARVLRCQFEGPRVEFVVDLTSCYPVAAGCRRLVRSFSLDRDSGRLEIKDEYDLDGPGEVESMIICASPVLPGAEGVLIPCGDRQVQVTPERHTVFRTVDVCEYRNREGVDDRVYRLRFGADAVKSKGALRVVLLPR